MLQHEAQAQGNPAWAAGAAALFNLVPIVGVLFWDWSAFAVIFLYWLENVVIGARTLASMAASAAAGGGGARWVGLAFIGPFFTVHYGMFCFVHGVFVTQLFGQAIVDGTSPFALAEVARALIAKEANLAAGFVSIALWQGVQFALFLMRGEAGRTGLQALMGAPYPRIVVLHLTILAGGALLMALNEPLAGLLLLVLVKTGFDVAEIMGVGPRFGPRRAEN